jgi:hypothetical protein
VVTPVAQEALAAMAARESVPQAEIIRRAVMERAARLERELLVDAAYRRAADRWRPDAGSPVELMTAYLKLEDALRVIAAEGIRSRERRGSPRCGVGTPTFQRLR